jgi:hypothetical protein
MLLLPDLSRPQREALFPPEVDGVGCGRPMDLADPIQARASNRTRLRKSQTIRRSGNNDCAGLGLRLDLGAMATYAAVEPSAEYAATSTFLVRGAGSTVSVTVSGEVETLSVA